MGDLALFHASTAAASVDDLDTTLKAGAVHAPESGGSKLFLKLDQDDGVWMYGADNDEVEEGDLFAINPFSLRKGYVAWADPKLNGGKRQKLGEVMGPLSDPPVMPGVDHSDRGGHWADQYGFDLAGVSEGVEGVELVYHTNSDGGAKAFANLYEAIAGRPSREHCVPIVRLLSDAYKNKTYGRTIHTPKFEVVDWATLQREFLSQAGKEAPEAVDKDQRQVGKVVVLSAGYGGGYRAFQAMARAYKVVMSDEDAGRIIQTWRANNPWAPRFWRDLERAAVAAVRRPGSEHRAGRMTYCKPDFKAPLYCLLPGGTILTYPDARIDEEETDRGPRPVLSAIKAAWKPAKGETDWGRVNLYGGLLAENCTQATAAAILRHALALCAEDGWPVVGHVHDEIVLEVRADEEVEAKQALAGAMLDLPDWAAGLPMKAETQSGRRYGK
jgi:hypothetical protein